MQLARSITDEGELKSLSLRQAYFRLGIATEPKIRRRALRVAPLPAYVRNAQRLLLSVRMRLRLRPLDAETRNRLRADLSPLHRQLNALFGENNESPPHENSRG